MEVEEVATFYTMINLQPVGKYHLQVCRSISCFIMGSNGVRRRLEPRLGIGPGQTTKDGLFTLSEVECLGACGTAPVMQVNEDYHEDLNPERVDAILTRLRAEWGGRVMAALGTIGAITFKWRWSSHPGLTMVAYLVWLERKVLRSSRAAAARCTSARTVSCSRSPTSPSCSSRKT